MSGVSGINTPSFAVGLKLVQQQQAAHLAGAGSGHGTIRIPAGSSTGDAEKFLTMLRIALTQLLEKQYDAAVKVNSIRVATAQADCVALELEIEIFGEAPSRTYVEIIK